MVQWILRLQNWLRLESYKKMFHTLREKTGSLSATEAFSADVIHLLGRPTLGQFAATLGISQPNATYKVNNLAAKGYLEKIPKTGARYASRLPENSMPITTTMSRRCARPWMRSRAASPRRSWTRRSASCRLWCRPLKQRKETDNDRSV